MTDKTAAEPRHTAHAAERSPVESNAARPNTREAILDAARAEMTARGDFSVNAVAARAGVSRQAVQYHFGGARGLRETLAKEGLGRALPHEPTEERLITAAIEVLSQPGGGRASIEEIAAQAGMTKGAIYHHFADRTELLRAVAKRISPADAIVGALQASEGQPIEDALVAFASTYYREMNARVDLVRSLAVNAARDPEVGEVVMTEIIGRAVPYVFEWFGRRIAAGELRPIDPSLLVQAMFGPVFLVIVMGPAVVDRLRAFGVKTAVDNVEEYIELLLDGVRPYTLTPETQPGR